MNTQNTMLLRRWALALLYTATYSVLQAQQAPATPAPSAATPAVEDELLVLSPFEVTSEGDSGYTATSTLGGTRVRTDLRDIASSLSVVTPQFLQDTAATSNQTLLPYQVNTEVGGFFGNFAGVGNTQSANESGKLNNPNSNTRVRGLDSADNTRDYFRSSIGWDSYIVDRVDLQRGPNSILFGVGSPAGIVNVTTIGARLDKSGGKVEAAFASYGSQRYNLDYNQVLLKGELALRVAAVDDNTKYQQDPAYSHAKRGFAALRYAPQLFSKDIAGRLSVRINAEKGSINSNNPRMLPPIDKLTNFFDPSIFRRENGQVMLYDPTYAWSYYQNLDRGSKAGDPKPVRWRATEPAYYAVPGLSNDMFKGFVTYDNGASQPYIIRDHKAGSKFGISSTGLIDGSISAVPFGGYAGVAGLNQYSLNLNSLDPTKYPAAAKELYKDRSITDPSIFDFYNKLLDGNNKKEWQDFEIINVAIAQNFLNNRVGIEAVYDYQNSDFGSEGYLGWQPYISVDVNKYTMDTLASYYPNANEFAPYVNNGGGTINPDAGRAYTQGTGSGNSTQTTREDWRLTAYGELRGSDVFAKDSFWAKLLSKNVVSALFTSDQVDDFQKNWDTERTDINWRLSQGETTAGRRSVGWTTYLTPSLVAKTGAAGLNIDRLRSTIQPFGEQQGTYFDSHWKYSLVPGTPGYVNPAAAFTNPNNQAVLTQSENPANYVGWKSQPVDILSSSHGDIDQLYYSTKKIRDTIDSQGFTLQSFIWDDMAVGTIGWRKDKITTYNTLGAVNLNTQVASANFDNIQTTGNTQVSEGETLTWGLVARLPKSLRGKLAGGLDASAFYNNSENFRPLNRIGFSGEALRSPSGQSKDYGFVVSALDDRVSLKVTWYDTKVSDVNLEGPLANEIWFLRNMQIWGAAKVQKIKAGLAGQYTDMGAWNQTIGVYNLWGDPKMYDVTSPEFNAHPETTVMKNFVADWIKTMPSQAYFDAMGFEIDVAKFKNPDWNIAQTAISHQGKPWKYDMDPGILQPSRPDAVATIDNQSKGIEVEFAAKPVKNWDLVFNVAKTEASRTGLNAGLVAWIEGQKKRLDGPSGDVRLWWSGDGLTYRAMLDKTTYQPYLFQKESDGKMAPEIRQYRFNLVNNYHFDSGKLKGVNIGLGYRWQDDMTLGYALNDAKTNLDVNRPIMGGAEGNFDGWIGYGHKLSPKVFFRVQLNVRNIGETDHLIPVSVNPDGSYAQLRIADGMTWTLRNTFEF